MTADNKFPGFTAEDSLKRSSDDYAEKARSVDSTKRLVTPQGCCVPEVLGICALSSPFC